MVVFRHRATPLIVLLLATALLPSAARAQSAPRLATIGILDDPVDTSVASVRHARSVRKAELTNPHGTIVASVAAGRRRGGQGIDGVAPGAPLLSFGTASRTCAELAEGIDTLSRRGARVINVSLTLEHGCRALREAVARAYTRRTTVVAAAGNIVAGSNSLQFPAAQDHAITVGALGADGGAADFSRTNPFVDLAAPGVKVPAALPTALDVTDDSQDGLTLADGTSLAAPQVTGAVSWILGARPGLDPGQVARLLRSTARPVGAAGWDAGTGWGVVQLREALAAPTPPRDPFEPNDEPWMVRTNSGVLGQRALWTGGRARSVTAWGDSADDPIDAYRVVLPPRSRAKVTLTTLAGSVGLYAFSDRARSFFASTHVLARSTRPARRHKTIRLRNTGARPRTVFVVANTTGPRDGRSESRYRLRVLRP